MSRVACNTVGQAISSSSSSGPLRSSSYEKHKSEVNQHMAEKSESSLSDADSYQTADDDDQPSTWQVPVDDAKEQQDGSEYESSSSSSRDEDDSDTDEKVTEGHSRLPRRCIDLEKRRKASYQFAVTESGDLVRDTDDDDVVHDLDPREFHHRHKQKSRRSDEDSELVDDLDPLEFMHSSTQEMHSSIQETHVTSINMTINANVLVNVQLTSTGSAEDDKSRSDEQRWYNSEVFVDDPPEGPLDAAVSLLHRGHSEMSSTERHESTIEGNVLPTIIIRSPTEKTLVTDRREHIVRRCTKRAVFIPEHLLPFIAVGNGQLTNQVLTSVLHRYPPDNEELVPARRSSTEKDKETLPVIAAVVSEKPDIVHAKLISSSDLWEQYPDTNLSSSPEKGSHYSFEEGEPYPDYGSSTSSSDTGSEAEADVAVGDDIHSDTPPHRTDRSPTPDYMPSPISERGTEFGKLADGERAEIEEVDDVKEEFERDPSHSFARRGSQRFPKPVHHPISEPALPQQADEDKTMEYDQNNAELSNAIALKQSIDSMRDPCWAHEECRAGMEPAPVAFSQNEQGMFDKSGLNTRTSSAHIYNTLGSQKKRRRTGTRSVVISCCFIMFTEFLAVLNN